MSRKSIILLFATIAFFVTGAIVAIAQDDDPTLPPFCLSGMHSGNGVNFGSGMMRGHGSMMGGGFGSGMMWGGHQSMLYTVADVLDMEPQALFDALNSGQPLSEIAARQGVTLEAIYDAIFVQAEEHMADAVEAGFITQEQADEHLAWMRENITEMPMFTDGNFGPCMNGNRGPDVGMMGRGMMWGNQ